jgi:hypothetical protein
LNRAALLVVLVILCSGILSGRPQRKKTVANRPPIISAFESSSKVLNLCPSPSYCAPNNRKTVTLVVKASDPDGDLLTFHYSTTVGEILGQGSSVTWKLEGATFGSYLATVTVMDSKGGVTTSQVTIETVLCESCSFFDGPCPIIVVTSFDKAAYRGEQILFDVTVTPGYFQSRPDYIWTVSAGKILRGQNTPRIEVEPTGEVGENVTATVEVDGLDLACSRRASYSLLIEQ